MGRNASGGGGGGGVLARAGFEGNSFARFANNFRWQSVVPASQLSGYSGFGMGTDTRLTRAIRAGLVEELGGRGLYRLTQRGRRLGGLTT